MATTVSRPSSAWEGRALLSPAGWWQGVSRLVIAAPSASPWRLRATGAVRGKGSGRQKGEQMRTMERDGGSMHDWRALSLRGKAAVWLISLSVDDHKRMRIILGATCWPTPEQWGHAWQQDLSMAEHVCRVHPTSPWGKRGEGGYPTTPSPGSRKGALRHPLSTLLAGSH